MKLFVLSPDRSSLNEISVRCITKNKLQTISELYNSSARPKSLVPLCRRTPSADIDHWRDQERERNGRLAASLENCGELHPLRAAVVPREEVRTLIIHSLSYHLFTWLFIEFLQNISTDGRRFMRGNRYKQRTPDAIDLRPTGPSKLRQVLPLFRRDFRYPMSGE